VIWLSTTKKFRRTGLAIHFDEGWESSLDHAHDFVAYKGYNKTDYISILILGLAAAKLDLDQSDGDIARLAADKGKGPEHTLFVEKGIHANRDQERRDVCHITVGVYAKGKEVRYHLNLKPIGSGGFRIASIGG
jgi:hypothetical protein